MARFSWEEGAGEGPGDALIAGLTRHELEGGALFWSGTLPGDLLPGPAGFEEIWSLHPEEYHQIVMYGRAVETPRYQQAFGADYHYAGRKNLALPTPAALQALLAWGQSAVDSRLNGVLLNWYEGALGHYIGRHRDSTKNMIEGAPIVTISLGQERAFRLRPWKRPGKVDFPAKNGTVFVLPYSTNLKWTHEVPASKRLTGRRISITLRGFVAAGDEVGGQSVAAD